MNRINTGFVSDPSIKQQFTVKSLDFLQDTNKDMLVGMAQSIVGENYSLSTPYILKGLDAYGSNQYNVGYILYNGEVYYSSGKANTTPFTNIAVMTITSTNGTSADPLKFTDSVNRDVHDVRTINLSDALTGTGTFDLSDAIYIQNFNFGEVLSAQTSTSTIYCPDSNNNDPINSYEIDFSDTTYTNILLLTGSTNFKTGSVVNIRARSITGADSSTIRYVIFNTTTSVTCAIGDILLFYGITDNDTTQVNIFSGFGPPSTTFAKSIPFGATVPYLLGSYAIVGGETAFQMIDSTGPWPSISAPITVSSRSLIAVGPSSNIKDYKSGNTDHSFPIDVNDSIQFLKTSTDWVIISMNGEDMRRTELADDWIPENTSAGDPIFIFYRKDKGFVYLTGVLNTTMPSFTPSTLTLPIGYRPSINLSFKVVDKDGNIADLTINSSTGVVNCTDGFFSTKVVDLKGISFKTS